jgi:hypothetical protein
MIERLEMLKIMLINIWPTYDLPVRTEAGRKSTTWCISSSSSSSSGSSITIIIITVC